MTPRKEASAFVNLPDEMNESQPEPASRYMHLLGTLRFIIISKSDMITP